MSESGTGAVVKILIVTKGYYPHGDANGAVVRNLADALTGMGHSLHVVGLSGERADTAVTRRRSEENADTAVTRRLAEEKADAVLTRRQGERITNLYVPEMRSRAQLMGNLKGHFVKTAWLIARRALAEGKRSAFRKYRELSVYPPYAKAYRRFFRDHLRQETYDLVLITLMPQDAVWAWQREGSPLPWAVYQLDTFWNRGTDTEEHLEERKAFERKMAEECAFVLTTPLIAEENARQWPELKGKWIPSEFPMVVRPEGIRKETDFVRERSSEAATKSSSGQNGRRELPFTEEENDVCDPRGQERQRNGMNGNPVHLVFAGALYPGLRPPEQVIQVVAAWRGAGLVRERASEAVPNSSSGWNGKRELTLTERTAREEAPREEMVCFDFYGSHQELIEASPDYDRARDWLALHGQVSSGEAAAAREAADFLINIDNTNPMQVPSKIFEYISTGKPIVNFVFDDASPILPYLADYPLCLTINLNRMEDGGREAAERLSAFVRENRGKRIPFEEIRERYRACTPEYVARQLVEAVPGARS